MIPKDGVLLEEPKIGAQNVYTIRNPEGAWPSPPGEDQFSHQKYGITDSMACVSYSAIHCIESQLLKLTGSTPSFSERFLAKMSGTTREGNYLSKVADTINQYGLVTDDLWPEPETFTWDEYYADIPQGIISQAKRYHVTLKYVPESEIGEALKESPLQIIVTKENPDHAVELISATEYFDTYQPYIKEKGSVYQYYNLTVELPAISYIKRNEQFWQINLDGTMSVVTDEAVLQKLYFGGLTYKTIN